jgi:cytochrome c-type biogenesis protein CcmH
MHLQWSNDCYATRVLHPFVAVLAGVLALAPGAVHALEPAEAQARALEERLHAPCCRGQLLDAHESEVTRALRSEIRTRLRAGETATALEAEFVRRYGASIVAVPRDADPRDPLSLALTGVLALSALWLVVLGVRWVRRTRAAPDRDAPAAPDHVYDELDARLDAELDA